ncbi:MAG: adenosylcobinamide amidohydrolase, partial [Spirochaetia bacterium]|nr:adenosylcobinamide amidohydrolase [Spirochaetia bacterium]
MRDHSAGEDFPLLTTKYFSVRRRGRFVIADLHSPHLVLSTSYVNGGMDAGLRHLVNHQCSEGRRDILRHDVIAGMGQEEYHKSVAGEISVPSEGLALMSTAAQMQMTAVETERHEEIQVWALATAGVQGNAGRAGDPATWHEAAAS